MVKIQGLDDQSSGDVGIRKGLCLGPAKGLVSPITDLWGLVKLGYQLEYKVIDWTIDQASKIS